MAVYQVNEQACARASDEETALSKPATLDVATPLRRGNQVPAAKKDTPEKTLLDTPTEVPNEPSEGPETVKSLKRFREPASLDSVAAFHERFKCPTLDRPQLPSRHRMNLRLNLIQEEVRELQESLNSGDLVEAADALADIQYVLTGTVHELGMGHCFAELVEEVHRSNMSKACTSYPEAERTVSHYAAARGVVATIDKVELDGQKAFLVKRASDGKALKSVDYSPPNLAPILARAGAIPKDLLSPQNPVVAKAAPVMQKKPDLATDGALESAAQGEK
mmetsp:Transcript_9276/g.17637  ORF Transcript_9276/g.17637 Transcript_9276/m.17637 type:complete len:278 (+) Transcript_9276:165-998(+)